MNGMNRRVTIKDVAEMANVSIGTVSRAINNNGYVGKEAKERIDRAIQQLNYIPNATARSMVNKRSSMVGVAVPEINNPFLADLVVKIEANLSKKNYSIMLCNTQYKAGKLKNFVDDLIMRNAEGLILVSTDVTDEVVLRKIQMYLYTVAVGQRVADFDCVRLADYKSAYDLTTHLIRIGHRRIACIGYNPNASVTMDRLHGYQGALQEAGIPIREEYLLPTEGSGESGYLCTKKLLSLEVPPTAIVAINDFYALNTYVAITEAGKKVGENISVVGFDDVMMSRFIYPALTTVSCDTDTMASMATSMLLDKIATQVAEMQREIVLPSTIALRDSVKSCQEIS